jgi:hypothetical protein
VSGWVEEGSSQVYGRRSGGEEDMQRHTACNWTYLRESSVVPDVTMVGEAISNESKLVLFDILLDGIEKLFLANLQLRVSPSGNLNDHV